MLKKLRTMSGALLVVFVLLLSIGGVGAQGLEFDPGGEIKDKTGLTANDDLPGTVINFVNIFLQLLALAATVMIIYGGFRYMTAGGNEENVKSAKAVIKNAAIGLVIVLLAYAITSFVFQTTVNVTTAE